MEKFNQKQVYDYTCANCIVLLYAVYIDIINYNFGINYVILSSAYNINNDIIIIRNKVELQLIRKLNSYYLPMCAQQINQNPAEIRSSHILDNLVCAYIHLYSSSNLRRRTLISYKY